MTDTDLPEIDTSVPHEARMYDYWLGGKDNYAPDRALGDMIRERIPSISTMARANRAFVARSVRFLVQECGVRQFLDIGTGIPTAPNVHHVAQEIAPETRVLYVDKDPIVLAHARALMTSSPEGRTDFLLGDFRDPDSILGSPQLQRTLDLDRPVALMLVAVAMYFDPEAGEDPYPLVARYLDALPSGSYLALTHPTGDFDPEAMAGVRAVSAHAGITIVPRSLAEVERFAAGLERVEPGFTPVVAWRPDAPVADERSAYYWAGVARKP